MLTRSEILATQAFSECFGKKPDGVMGVRQYGSIGDGGQRGARTGSSAVSNDQQGSSIRLEYNEATGEFVTRFG
jgi:hypothetical protein